MASTYVNDLRLNEMATGDASGSWGTVTNTNLELIGEAFSYGTETIGDADSTLTIADGAADAARSFYLKITSSVDLTTTRIVTLAPNTVSKVWMIENATTGSQVITIKQGSGATINVPNGQVKMISTDGAGSGGAVLDLLVDVDLTGTTTLVNLDVSGTALVTGVLTTTAATVFNGGFTANADSTLGTDKKVQFRDAAIYINSSVDGQLDIVADTEIQIAATTVDLNGNLDVSGTLGVTGVLTATSLDISGDIDVDGTTNLDVVDIDGAVDMASTLLVTGVLTTTAATVSNGGGQFNGAINVGVDDTGYDVKFFGATAGAYMLWDESADDLILGGAAGLSVNSTALVTGVLTTTAATVHTGGITMPDNANLLWWTDTAHEH
jgi:cytoskeletal protein CcmA (bactofilin family)